MQQVWDEYGDMMEPLLATLPSVYALGNHEKELRRGDQCAEMRSHISLRAFKYCFGSLTIEGCPDTAHVALFSDRKDQSIVSYLSRFRHGEKGDQVNPSRSLQCWLCIAKIKSGFLTARAFFSVGHDWNTSGG